MTQPFVGTLITGMVIGWTSPAVSAIDLSSFLPVGQPYPATQRARGTQSSSSVIPWADETPSRTSMPREIWVNQTLRLKSDLELAFAQCQIESDRGKSVFDRATAFLRASNVPVVDVEVRVVVDPEDELHMTEVSFLINDEFDSAMRIDRQLTRHLVKEVRIPTNLTVTVRETVEEFA